MPTRPFCMLTTAVVAVALLTGLASSASAADPFTSCPAGLLPAKSETTQTAYPAGVRSVVLDTGAGSVTIAGGSGARTTTVQTRGCSSGTRPTLTEQLVDGVLYLASRCASPPGVLSLLTGACSRSFSLVVPDSVEVSATTGGGTIRTESITGPQSLVSGGGAVSATGTSGERVRLSTASGDVTVESVHAPDELYAATMRGNVSVTVPGGTYDIDAQASGGKVSLSGVTNDAAAPRRLTASTGSGDVTIRARAKGAAPVATASPKATLPVCPALALPLCSPTR